MTHVLSRDLNPSSPSAGQEIRIPVTVVECPKMRILGVRGYAMTPYGKQAAGEVWADAAKIAEAFAELFKRLPVRKEHDAEKHFENLMDADLVEVRLICATQPNSVTGVPTKVPDVMEVGLDGGNMGEQLAYAKEKLGEEYSFADAFEEGALTDIVAITKGYGWQGVIKRFGGKLQSHKNSKKRRQHVTWVLSVTDMFESPSVKVDKPDTINELSTTSAFYVLPAQKITRSHLLAVSSTTVK